MRGAILAPLLLGATAATAATKPNIIFIVTDDQNTNTMGCWGGDVITPNIDRIASEGVMFNRAYTASSISSPSRYSILSGRYSSMCQSDYFKAKYPDSRPTRMDNESVTLDENLPNLARLLKEGGYTTGMVGKWHVGQHFSGSRIGEVRQKSWEKGGLKYYDIESDAHDSDVEEALLHNHDWYAEKIKSQGFDYADNIYWANLLEVWNKGLNYHNIDWSVKGAFEFMDQAGDKPFFLYFSTTLHHGPVPQLSLPEQFETVTSKGYAKEKMGVMPERETIFARLEEAGINKSMAYTLWLDDAVGALLSKLERDGKLDNTVIFYVSDHGIVQKASMYEGGVRTPMMVWGKDYVKSGSVSSRLVHTCDMSATALDIAGVEAPKKANMVGYSLLPLLKEPDMDWRSSVFSEVGFARCVVTDKYKYIAVRYPKSMQEKYDRGFTEEEQKKFGYIGNNDLTRLGKTNPNYFAMNQLYDLENDPMERNNLFDDPKYKDVRAQMHKLMEGYLSKFKGRTFYEFYDGYSKTIELNEFDRAIK